MGRPRTFSEPDVVARASAVFARRGFAATSVDDLVRATGVGRASLYGAFGSKDGLFQRCLSGALAALAPGPADPAAGADPADPADRAGALGPGFAADPAAGTDSAATPDSASRASRLGGSDTADPLDLVLVALMELAPDDAALAADIGRALRRARVGPADLGARLLARASL
ncbi:hypothetical protein AM609_12690 [Actinomyces sp. oral taxon 414]|uniref:helix-turn-helix domain-containing protein n=1 Tax=Actinomyces sp. oral taxon 414 TaxID=712122 RepID=UPI0006BCA7A5|nr:helix-turn-helix domain-containing protein [Actinomyces sp. oral taxon 414]ALD00088.1 hypothetical protein AM609_12690 [Actinomyces sp. oral taxon 414]